jgi:hypothetical protein
VLRACDGGHTKRVSAGTVGCNKFQLALCGRANVYTPA